MVTNFGRVQHFGCHVVSDQFEIVDYVEEARWLCLSNQGQGKVHGLAFEVPEYTRQTDTVSGIGVTQDISSSLESMEGPKDEPPRYPIHARGPTLPSPPFTVYLARIKPRTGYGFSTASMDNIATLHVWKKKMPYRTGETYGCYGLRILHRDSTVEILGRWDPRDQQCISKIYDASEGALMTISFHLEPSGPAAFVEGITLEVTDNPLGYKSPEELSLVPMEPPDHAWDCDPYYNSTFLPTTRTFDCSQTSQVSQSNLLCSYFVRFDLQP